MYSAYGCCKSNYYFSRPWMPFGNGGNNTWLDDNITSHVIQFCQSPLRRRILCSTQKSINKMTSGTRYFHLRLRYRELEYETLSQSLNIHCHMHQSIIRYYLAWCLLHRENESATKLSYANNTTVREHNT
jgi:hypothetical protein